MSASKDAGIVLPCMLAMAEILANGDVLLSRADNQEQDNHTFRIIWENAPLMPMEPTTFQCPYVTFSGTTCIAR